MSGVALLDKAGWAPLGAGDDETHPMLVAVVGLVMIVVVPLVWGVLRRQQGLPMFGSPTVAELEGEQSRPTSPRRPYGVSARTPFAIRWAPRAPDSMLNSTSERYLTRR